MTHSASRMASALGAALLLSTLTSAALAQNADAPRLSLPVKCTLGVDCWVQNLPDFDPTDRARDPLCGPMSYDTHNGTDIRVATLGDLKRKIPIRAMADGKVTALRNTADEKLVESDADRAAVKDKECGNGVIIDHGGGWTTQLCHLAKGSVSVKKGDTVKRGDAVGMMGMSGLTQFPHVHAVVRKDMNVTDPLTGRKPDEDCSANDTFANSLFGASLAAQLPQAASALIGSGFTSKPVSSIDILKGDIPKPSKAGPVVFFAKFINVRKGDMIEIDIDGPNGTFLRHRPKPIASNSARWTVYTGRKVRPQPGATYRADVRLIRDGSVIASTSGIDASF